MSFYPPAVQRPGPDWKVWPEQNSCEGAILHSLEGSSVAALNQLTGTVSVSWHFTMLKDGSVWQHYPLTASCWHAGGKAANTRLIGVEHEGKAGEPLTEAQTQASVALVRWLSATCGWPMERHTRLLEHNEVFATACPSGRIPWSKYVPENSGADIRDGQDVGLNRLDGESAGRALRDAENALTAALVGIAAARAVLVEMHKRNGGDGDLIRGA